MAYAKTNWVDGSTRIVALLLNKLENGVAANDSRLTALGTKSELIQAVVDAIKVENPGAHVIYGDIGDNNDITLRGDVAPGVYTVSYVNADGSETYIGELKVADDGSVTTVDVPITWIFNVKLSKTTGEVENSNDGDYNASDFIELVSGAKYTVSTQTDTFNSLGVLYYDASKDFVSYQADCWVSNNTAENPEDGSPQSCSLEIPEGAVYIRLRQFETWNEQGASTAYVKLQYTTA